MQVLIDLIKDIFIGIYAGITDLFNWKKPPRQKPEEQEETSWKKFLIYREWRSYIVREIVEQIVIILILLIVIREGVGEFRYIPSESMEPTLIVGDKLFVEKFSKRFQKQLNRGDIVIFYPPENATDDEDVLKYDPFNVFSRLTGLPFLPQPEAYIKRIVGLPGDEIEIKRKEGVYINGELLSEPYHEGSKKFLPDYNIAKLTVPADHYYVLGDNRNYSFDSHFWGPLPKSRVIGRAAFLIYRPLDEKPYLAQEEDLEI